MLHTILDPYTDLCTVEVCEFLSLSLGVRLVFSCTGCTKVSLVGCLFYSLPLISPVPLRPSQVFAGVWPPFTGRLTGVQTHCQHTVFYWVIGLKQSEHKQTAAFVPVVRLRGAQPQSQIAAQFRHNSSTHGSLDLKKDSSITDSLLRTSTFVITNLFDDEPG